jgi:hypothetical protein
LLSTPRGKKQQRIFSTPGKTHHLERRHGRQVFKLRGLSLETTNEKRPRPGQADLRWTKGRIYEVIYASRDSDVQIWLDRVTSDLYAKDIGTGTEGPEVGELWQAYKVSDQGYTHWKRVTDINAHYINIRRKPNPGEE